MMSLTFGLFTQMSGSGPLGPLVNSGLDFIKMNILTKFHEYWIKTVPSGVYSWFF